ncbi:MAG TPA: GNAT family acetyltransferase [Clostridiales bacterium]|jgi:hypothetical protein|nr:GNAT family acetyltransferase [Clostridiales bacterium]
MEIRFATPSDLDSLLDLLRANHADNVPDEEKKFGFVTTQITKEQLIDLIEQENGVTVAVDGGRVVSFALAGAWEYWKPWPLFSYMIEILETFQHDGVTMTTENCYQYGPICIDKDYRSTGLFEKVFDFSLASMADRFPYMVTFINQINPRSYAAHVRKGGMVEAGKFDWNNNHYWMMSIRTK